MLLDRMDELDLRVHDLRGDRARLVADLVERIDKCRDQLVSAEAVPALGRGGVALGGLALGRPPRAPRGGDRARATRPHDRWLDEAGREDFGLSIVRALELLRAHPDRLRGRPRGRPPRAGRRVPGHQPRPGRAPLPAGRRRRRASWWWATTTRASTASAGASSKNIADFRAPLPGCGRAAPGGQPPLHPADPRRRAAAVVSRSPTARPRPSPRCRAPTGRRPASGARPTPTGRPARWRGEIVRLAGEGVPLEEQAVLMRAVRLEARPVIEALERAGIPHQVRGGIRALRAARGARGGGLAARRGRSVRRPGAPAARRRPAPRPALDGGRRRGVGRRGPRRRRWRGALAGVAREAGADGARRRAGGGRARRRRRCRRPTRCARSSTVSGLRRGGGRGRRRRGRGAAGRAGRAGAARRARSPRPSRPSTPAASAARLAGLAEIGFRGESIAPPERAGVQVMTVHQAKGLEFDAVFVIGMVRSSFPGSDRGGVDIPDALLPEVLPRGPRRPRGRGPAAGLRRDDPRPAPPGARHLRGQRGRRPPGPLALLRGGPRGARAPSWRTWARRPSAPCWRASGERHAAFEQASLRAASAIAAGAGDAAAPAWPRPQEAARDLVAGPRRGAAPAAPRRAPSPRRRAPPARAWSSAPAPSRPTAVPAALPVRDGRPGAGARRARRGRSASRPTPPSRRTTARAAPAGTASSWCGGSPARCGARAWPTAPRAARRWPGPARPCRPTTSG